MPERIETEIGGHPVIVSHYPFVGDTAEEDRFRSIRPVDDGRPVIHGHVHDAFAVSGRQFNVGVDVRDFTPVPEEEIVAWLESLQA